MMTWWIDEPALLGSSNPDDAGLEELRAAGLDVLVSLLDEPRARPRYDAGRAEELGFERHVIAVRDLQPPTVDQLALFVRLVEGRRAVVHCEAGCGRTGTFAAAYFVARGMTPARAFRRVAALVPRPSEITFEQKAAVRAYARTLARDRTRRPGMGYYLLTYDVAKDYVERRAPLRDEHLRLARAAHARGELLLGGAVGDPVDSALLVFRGDTADVAESFARVDPYVTGGVVQRWTVRPWTVVIGA